jgi:hypothetical protein
MGTTQEIAVKVAYSMLGPGLGGWGSRQEARGGGWSRTLQPAQEEPAMIPGLWSSLEQQDCV